MFPRTRGRRVLGTLALAAILTAAQPTPADVYPLCDTDQSCVELQVALAQHDGHVRRRVLDAAGEAVTICRDWLGSVSSPLPIAWDEPAIDVEASMAIEAHVARSVMRTCLAPLANQSDEDRRLAEGLSEYLHARAVEALFDRRYQRLAYAIYTQPLFGASFAMPIRGIHVTRLSQARHAPANRIALAFLTLERYLGEQRLQRAIRAAMTRPPTDTTPFVGAMEAAVGQDLRWLFDPLLRGERFDYAVRALTSDRGDCDSQPCYRTHVVVQRQGSAQFTGTNAVPVGRYPQGRGLTIAVAFADGSLVRAAWDGRAPTEELHYESAVPALDATLDAGRVLVADVNLLDNFRTLTPRTNIDVPRWTGQWAVWLQHTLLTAAFFF